MDITLSRVFMKPATKKHFAKSVCQSGALTLVRSIFLTWSISFVPQTQKNVAGKTSQKRSKTPMTKLAYQKLKKIFLQEFPLNMSQKSCMNLCTKRSKN